MTVPVAISWPRLNLVAFWDAWAARLNPRYVISRQQLAELEERLKEWRALADSLDSSSASSR